MKRILLCLLAVLMIASCISLPAFAQQSSKDQGIPSSEEVKAELPSSFTLVGTPDLPPICNQGEVGCCASCAITYTQYTNAVSKYIRKYHPEIKFEPATGEKQYLFSPKWTYGFAGAGTKWVYDILKEQGAVTMDVSSFYLHPLNGSFLVHRTTATRPLVPSAISWDIAQKQMEQAMNYRLTDFEQIWVGGDHQYAKVDGKLEMTTSEEGKALMNKIKESLNAGNVVVTGGLSGAWVFTDPANGGKVVGTGTLGKRGDKALMFSRGALVGGHQVSIVGYDDNIQCEYDGTVMTGAFLVSNSWGEEWMNGGYVWLMYDALNERSEHEALNFEDRVLSMDQFCFTDWDKGISEGLPALYVEAEVSAENRENINLQPVVKDAGNVEKKFSPHMFEYNRYHPTYDELKAGDYFTIDGKKNGKEATGTFALDYYGLISEEEEIKNLSYGIRIQPRAGSVTVHALRLKNSRGQVIAEIAMPEGGTSLNMGTTFYFESELYKVTFDQTALEGSSYEAFSAYYNKGNKVSIDIKLEGGHTVEEMDVKTDGGELLKPDADGVFELTVSKDTVLSYNWNDQYTPDKPSETPKESPSADPSVSTEPSAETTPTVSESEQGETTLPEASKDAPASESDQNTDGEGGGSGEKDGGGAMVGIVIGVVVAVVVVAVVVVVILKKNKK